MTENPLPSTWETTFDFTQFFWSMLTQATEDRVSAIAKTLEEATLPEARTILGSLSLSCQSLLAHSEEVLEIYVKGLPYWRELSMKNNILTALHPERHWPPFVFGQAFRQIARYMQETRLKYGFISIYNESLFLRQFHDPVGDWQLQYSTIVRHEDSGSKITLRECMFFLGVTVKDGTSSTKIGVANKSLRNCEDLRSESRVTHEQYLLFRTIYLMLAYLCDPVLSGANGLSMDDVERSVFEKTE
ncbi:hypothetical protein BO78DRAFT_423097 [Aspergillus sclerotiicarbonarius CBS 121057]|uniref:Uncharacterized protein n=1 Tax=Aspergillus sclerotiicarbonarius (strain CBS 121057 / IBT 28362) TaxID=1448318 RepID=A0A319E0J4_ASPSB|nr:hypothetical protein BO78DRAFT_423097 [Aspergillus sclerotiicarbonarius CBS 121057]